MGIFFLVLAALSLVVLLVGAIWTLTVRGETEHSSGPDVGAEIMAEQMEDDEEAYAVEATAFKDEARMVERGVSISLSELKQEIRAGQWRRALPVLLALGGLAGALLFGALAAAFFGGDLLIGLLALGVVLYALVRMAVAFARA